MTSLTNLKYPETHYRGLRIYAAADVHRECMTIIESLGLPRGSSVLDLGAGEGAFSQRLVDQGFRVTAVDIAPDRYRAASPILALDLNGDFHSHLDERPDLITAIELVEHLQSPRHFIRECLTVVGPGGMLLFTSPNLESWVSRIRFLRSGRPAWFDENDYEESGHISPVFTWQVAQVCREQQANLRVMNTKSSSLWRSLGGSARKRLKNRTAWMGILYPLMQGHKKGEINIFLVQKSVVERAESG